METILEISGLRQELVGHFLIQDICRIMQVCKSWNVLFKKHVFVDFFCQMFDNRQKNDLQFIYQFMYPLTSRINPSNTELRLTVCAQLLKEKKNIVAGITNNMITREIIRFFCINKRQDLINALMSHPEYLSAEILSQCINADPELFTDPNMYLSPTLRVQLIEYALKNFEELDFYNLYSEQHGLLIVMHLLIKNSRPDLLKLILKLGSRTFGPSAYNQFYESTPDKPSCISRYTMSELILCAGEMNWDLGFFVEFLMKDEHGWFCEMVLYTAVVCLRPEHMDRIINTRLNGKLSQQLIAMILHIAATHGKLDAFEWIENRQYELIVTPETIEAAAKHGRHILEWLSTRVSILRPPFVMTYDSGYGSKQTSQPYCKIKSVKSNTGEIGLESEFKTHAEIANVFRQNAIE